ncbi:MAG: rhomboid family intramembrane serine protease [Bacteroidota bacterium]
MNHWEDEIKLPEKTDDIEYAYYLKSSHEPVHCSKEELFDKIGNDKDLKYIATPDHDHFIIPGMDYETLQPILVRSKAQNLSNLKLNGTLAIFMGVLFSVIQLTDDQSINMGPGMFWLFVFVVPLIGNIYQIYRVRNIDESNFEKESNNLKFDHWVDEGNNNSILVVAGTLAAIFFFQLIAGSQESIEFAGLVKAKTKEGEYWRLLTATLLHGNLMHIIFNGMAIYSIGQIVMRVTNFWYFAFVFLTSALIGSVFSLFLYPDITSVGASGGILGLIGFLIALTFRVKNVPNGISKSMISSVVFIAIVGLALPDVIDNAAHGGGLLAGILIGLLARVSHDQGIPLKSRRVLNIAGIISTLVLIAGVAFIMKLFFEYAAA